MLSHTGFLVGEGGFTPSGHKLRLPPPEYRYQKRDVIVDDVSFLVGEGGFGA